MRHRVFGEDAETGEKIEIVLDAESISDADANASRRGIKVLRIEVEGSKAADTQSSRGAQALDSGFDDDVPAQSQRESNEAGDEHDLWSGGPSQLINFCKFSVAFVVMAALLAGAILVPPRLSDQTGVFWWAVLPAILLPLLYMGFAWLRTSLVHIEVSNERLQERNGLLMRTVEEIELFRVKDIQQSQSLMQRFVGLGTLTLHTSDTTRPTMILNSIRGHRQLHNVLRKQVERLRKERGVREFDMNEAG